MNSVCLAVLNYNGIHHLESLLPGLEAACRQSPIPASIVILDNQSTQGDVEWVRQHYPGVRCVVSPKNDFLFSYNWLVEQLPDDVVVLLNNDLRVDEQFLKPLLRHFQSADVFAVSASSFDWEGNERTIGPARLTFRNGLYGWYYEPQRQELCHTLFASGGFMAVDRRKFLELGGFNRLFHPAYCEDLDLGFRAWRRGWRSIYEPTSIVWHREQASWKVSSVGRSNSLNLRHSLFFQWSSLPMETKRMTRYWTLVKLFGGELLRGKKHWLSIYPRTWREWCKIRKQYAGLKVSQQELAAMQKSMDIPLISGN